MPGPETISSLMQSRMRWLDVGVVENCAVGYAASPRVGEPGTDYDVVIRIDGSYANHDDAEVVAAFFRSRLAGVGLLAPEVVHLEDLTHE